MNAIAQPILDFGGLAASGAVRVEHGDCRLILPTIQAETAQLVITSPPYNIGKAYEKRSSLDAYLADQAAVITECARILRPGGSLCWQVGNHVADGEVWPLDALLYPAIKAAGLALRNRIVWTFEHGLHASHRFSGRHETVLWATKGSDYLFDLDPIRVPQKYPGKRAFKGPKAGQLSGNPLGKNPGDVWEIPNVKNNHPEKTDHPCQFPEELVRRFIAATTLPGDLVVDPYGGSGTTAKVARDMGRHVLLCEMDSAYVQIARNRAGL